MKNLKIIIALSAIVFAFAGCNSCNHNNSRPEKHTVKIGVLFSNTGNLAPYAEKALNGLNLAKENLNLTDVKIEWIFEDAKSNPKDAVTAAQKLITVDKVQVIIGPEASGLALAVAPIANENKVVLFAPTVAADKYTSPNDYTFRNWPTSNLIAEKAAEIAFNANYHNVTILTINNEMGVGYAVAFKNKFEALGGKIISTDNYNAEESNFSSHILNIKKLKPDALYLVGQVEMGQIFKQIKEQNLKTPVISGIGVEDPKVIEVAGAALNGVIYTSPSFNPNSQNDLIKNYETKFEKKYQKQSEIFAASTYDAVMILDKVISENNYSNDSIKNALFNIKNYSGVSGEISFDQNGDVIKSISVKKIVD